MNSSATRAALWAIFLLALALLSVAQVVVDPARQDPFSSPENLHRPNPYPEFSNVDPITAHGRLRVLNAERQKSLVSDAEKLLKLAQDLDKEISAKKPASLNQDQLRKVARIEKLARSVKEKMILTVGGGPSVSNPFARPFP